MADIPSEVDTEERPDNRIGVRPPRTRAWQDGRLLAEGFPVAEISDYLARPDTFVWMDLCAPDAADLHVISDELDLDATALEDAISSHERTKLDRYRDYLFLNVYVADLIGAPPDAADGAAGAREIVRTHEVSAFITERALVTVRQDAGFDVDELIRRWDESDDLAGSGVSYLLHGLLDYVVDEQFDDIQLIDDEVDELSGMLFDDKSAMTELQRRSFQLRRNLVVLRRIVLPMREVLNTLLRRDLRFVTEQMQPYYQDVYDHTLRASEWTDSLREMVSNIFDARVALQGNRLNEVMKKVTSWAAIIAVPTAVTGFYGQNVPYPGSDQHWGFVVSSSIVIGCSVGLYIIFKTRDWL